LRDSVGYLQARDIDSELRVLLFSDSRLLTLFVKRFLAVKGVTAAQKRKKMNDLQQNQISFLVQSSSILSKLASILDKDPTVLFATEFAGNHRFRRIQKRERKRVSGLIKNSYEDSLLLLTEVFSLLD
jgi:hypothetical protein